MMRPLWLIVGRELSAYFKGRAGYVIAALVLAVEGLLFNAFALGTGQRLSSEVLENFFYLSAGVTMIAGILLSMRVMAEERQNQTLVLLYTAPISDWHIAVGKWLASSIFLLFILILSLYMPLLIVVNGSITLGHLLAGYLGLLLLGSTTVALGTLASSMTRSQVVAGVLASGMVVSLLITWLLSRIVSPPFDGILSYMAFFDQHFIPFMEGQIQLRSVVYYASITFFSLLVTRHILGARRWRA